MRFSVVVPVYNNPADLTRCLASLGALDFPEDDFEIIVVDNNSTDNTAAVARSFNASVLEEKDFQSSYAARNRGIRAARGARSVRARSTATISWWCRVSRLRADRANLDCVRA